MTGVVSGRTASSSSAMPKGLVSTASTGSVPRGGASPDAPEARVGTDAGDQLRPGHAGHHLVHHQNAWQGLARQVVERTLAAASLGHLVALGLQALDQVLTQGVVVVDHEDPQGQAHASAM
jgi:hypothetical protein